MKSLFTEFGLSIVLIISISAGMIIGEMLAEVCLSQKNTCGYAAINVAGTGPVFTDPVPGLPIAGKDLDLSANFGITKDNVFFIHSNLVIDTSSSVILVILEDRRTNEHDILVEGTGADEVRVIMERSGDFYIAKPPRQWEKEAYYYLNSSLSLVYLDMMHGSQFFGRDDIILNQNCGFLIKRS